MPGNTDEAAIMRTPAEMYGRTTDGSPFRSACAVPKISAALCDIYGERKTVAAKLLTTIAKVFRR
jgi:hypothetical protein